MGLDTVVGVPFDCSGRFAGCERLPAALRAADLVERLEARDAGNLQVAIADPSRDPATGVVGFADVVEASKVVRRETVALLESGARPLVLGGCCTLLVGVAAAFGDVLGRVGLAFVDGHLDLYDGHTSETGEAADMELAILTGLGPAGLVDLAGEPPLVAPRDTVALGPRDREESTRLGAPDPATALPELAVHTPEQIREAGPATLGERTADALAGDPGRFWLHIDLDVLSDEALPAVDYLQPGGLEWEELAALAAPLARSPALVGADVTILNPRLDPEGRYARRAADLLVDLFG